jgi:hypothetical protein
MAWCSAPAGLIEMPPVLRLVQTSFSVNKPLWVSDDLPVKQFEK